MKKIIFFIILISIIFSVDNIGWNLENSFAAFSARNDHQVVAYSNKMWLIGGYNGTRTNDVWNSIDGLNWNLVTSNANFTGRNSHQVVVFSNKMWLIGGNNGSYKKDVYN